MSNGESPIFGITLAFPEELRVGRQTKDVVARLPVSEQQRIIAAMQRSTQLLTQAHTADLLYQFYRDQLFLIFPGVFIVSIDPTPSHNIFAFKKGEPFSTVSHSDLFWQMKGQEGEGRASVAVINASQIGVFVDNRHADTTSMVVGLRGRMEPIIASSEGTVAQTQSLAAQATTLLARELTDLQERLPFVTRFAA